MKITLLVIAIVLLALVAAVVIDLACFVAREREWKDMVDDEYYRINDGKEKNQ
ncbi:MAG: hypothetical protein KBT13_01945 [Bacteroidales bacterium]|nr:hypothetical protein [Candidatus Sodaliphilus limicaballi]